MKSASEVKKRIRADLDGRAARGLRRELKTWEEPIGWLNLADNDYLGLARDPALAEAAAEAASRHGCSASASPLISGYRSAHRELERELLDWHHFPAGMLWNTGFAANQAVLAGLPRKGDLVLADRLIHHSMVRGILRSGARLVRFRHNDLGHLESLLDNHAGTGRVVFVVTESVYSMDGDVPDLVALAALREKHGFFWILDEAHALGWHGSGLAAERGVAGSVDLLVGTLGKGLGAHGAHTLFQDAALRDYFANFAGEFIYSTYLSPVVAAAATAGVRRARELAPQQPTWIAECRRVRSDLREAGFAVPDGDSPIIPVPVGGADEVMAVADFLRAQKILAGAIRPPTVPAGESRLRISWKRTYGKLERQRLTEALCAWQVSVSPAATS